VLGGRPYISQYFIFYTQNENIVKKIYITYIIIQKTPEYTKRAIKKYYLKKKEEDPDFMKKKMESTKKWREENRERL